MACLDKIDSAPMSLHLLAYTHERPFSNSVEARAAAALYPARYLRTEKDENVLLESGNWAMDMRDKFEYEALFEREISTQRKNEAWIQVCSLHWYMYRC